MQVIQPATVSQGLSSTVTAAPAASGVAQALNGLQAALAQLQLATANLGQQPAAAAGVQPTVTYVAAQPTVAINTPQPAPAQPVAQPSIAAAATQPAPISAPAPVFAQSTTIPAVAVAPTTAAPAASSYVAPASYNAPASTAAPVSYAAPASNVTSGTYASTSTTTPARTTYAAPTTQAAPTAAPSSAGGFEQRVIDLVNQQRASYGLGPVQYNAQLDAAARGHAAQMGATQQMSHDGIGDGDPGSRIRSNGFGGNWAENVAVGQTSPEQVVAEWMASPEHRANILDPSFTQLGVEMSTGADGRAYWAQEFGA